MAPVSLVEGVMADKIAVTTQMKWNVVILLLFSENRDK
jgi:hypothetical protein